MKSDVQPDRTPTAAQAQAHAEFKEFVQRLQRARRQKHRASDDR